MNCFFYCARDWISSADPEQVVLPKSSRRYRSYIFQLSTLQTSSRRSKWKKTAIAEGSCAH
jgi:hypothetical protein